METVKNILSQLENADNNKKNQLENELVKMGSSVVPVLVSELQVVRGIKRGVVAMTLIRLGNASIDYLKQAADVNSDFGWVAEYLISEINCSKAA